ncbi:hypothetical protein GCM10022244_00710 [Streptomyces gulbargensis]|uniref:Uncharacterized protein n=1 Tax=Streptomyces gulbargensis TaxID=364901 RepID=A0ABP7L4D5_9ACTN
MDNSHRPREKKGREPGPSRYRPAATAHRSHIPGKEAYDSTAAPHIRYGAVKYPAEAGEGGLLAYTRWPHPRSGLRDAVDATRRPTRQLRPADADPAKQPSLSGLFPDRHVQLTLRATLLAYGVLDQQLTISWFEPRA